jgi:TonB family protein
MRVFRAIIISISFHLLALLLIVWLAPYFEVKPVKDVIQVELYPEGRILEALTPKEQKRDMVTQTLVPEKMRAQEDETLADFLSKEKQRVKEQMRAEKHGATANRDNAPILAQQKPMRPSGPKQNPSDSTDKDGYKSVDITNDLQEMNRMNSGSGFSTSNDVTDEVKAGNFTVLNTDQNIYYSFFARMRELVQYRFERRFSDTLETMDRRLLPSGESKWTTYVEFLLDKNGHVEKAKIMKLSGMPMFDLVGVAAFKEARIIPNPPQELIEEDGYIHIRIAFDYRVNSRWFAQDGK